MPFRILSIHLSSTQEPSLQCLNTRRVSLQSVAEGHPEQMLASCLWLPEQPCSRCRAVVTTLPGGRDNEGLCLRDLPTGWELLNKHIWRGKLSFLDLGLLVRLLRKHMEQSHQEQTLPSVPPQGLAGGARLSSVWSTLFQTCHSLPKRRNHKGSLELPVPSSASQGSWR